MLGADIHVTSSEEVVKYLVGVRLKLKTRESHSDRITFSQMSM